jgi:hypothetical protein
MFIDHKYMFLGFWSRNICLFSIVIFEILSRAIVTRSFCYSDSAIFRSCRPFLRFHHEPQSFCDFVSYLTFLSAIFILCQSFITLSHLT